MTCSEKGERREIAHSAEKGGLLEGREVLAQRSSVLTARSIDLFARASGDGAEQRLAFERPPVRAVGEAVLEHEVHPLLQQRWTGVPVDRVLEDDHVVLQQPLLLAVDVDHELRVLGVEVGEAHAGDLARRGREVHVDLGAVGARMGVEDQDSGHSGLLWRESVVTSRSRESRRPP